MPASLTITTHQTFGEHESEHTLYLQNDRSRLDPGAATPRTVIIRRCDLGRIFSLDLDAREYESCRLRNFNSRIFWLRRLPLLVAHPVLAWRQTRPRPATVLVETTTTDTGERKDIFGFLARRVITIERRQSLAPPDAGASETTTDGWYVDVETRITCERPPPGTRSFLTAHHIGQRDEVPQFRDIGPRERGSPVDATTTSVSPIPLPDGTVKIFRTTWRTWVSRLSTEALDPHLFEVPADFRKRRAGRQP